MKLVDLLPAGGGIVSVVGSGGKSTLLNQMARQLGQTVILATSTHMLAPEHCPVLANPGELDVEQALWYSRVVCVGTPVDESGAAKLAAPSLRFPTLAALADWVLVEADGSRQLPLKAHADYEPVVPEGGSRTILVVGASGFDRPVGEVVHRAELFSGLTGCSLDEPCSPALYAQGLAAELGTGRVAADVIAVNQADDEASLASARLFAEALRERGVELPVAAGSFRAGEVSEV